MKHMEKLGIIFSAVIIIITVFYTNQAGFISSSPGNKSDSVPTTTPTTMLTTAPTKIPTKIPTMTVTILSLTPTLPIDPTPNVIKNETIIYKSPEKIINSEELLVGDLIQMASTDPRFDKDHACIIEKISSTDNQYLIKEILKFGNEARWVVMESQTSRSITYGALMRDYPYKIGHVSGRLPQKCIICTNGAKICAENQVRIIDC